MDWEKVGTDVLTGVGVGVGLSILGAVWLGVRALGGWLNRQRLVEPDGVSQRICGECGAGLPAWFGNSETKVANGRVVAIYFNCFVCLKIVRSYPGLLTWPIARLRVWRFRRRLLRQGAPSMNADTARQMLRLARASARHERALTSSEDDAPSGS